MRVVGIGASAGGLEAIRALLTHVTPLDGATELAWVVVVHLDPTHASLLAEHLQSSTTMPVVQVSRSMPLEAGRVFVIPPGQGLALERNVLELAPLPERSIRAPIDRLFESLAADKGAEAAVVILSGTGADGTEGARRVAASGGLVLVQTPADAAFDGMPTSAVESGTPQRVGSVAELAASLSRWSRGETVEVSSREVPPAEAPQAVSPELLARLFEVMRRETSHDFSMYRESSLVRRVQHRMAVIAVDDLATYVGLLERDPTEAHRLLEDLLISVTRFFRDPASFAAVSSTVIPALLENRRANAPLRIWVPGCATGEEVYSLAILFSEALAEVESPPEVQIFGTDIDRDALEIARRGAYAPGIAEDVSAERLSRYFVATDDGFQVTAAIRSKCVFSGHDVARDPPFSRVDLVSCRNLLIYFDAAAKDRILDILYYGLAPNGFLFLGPSESVPRDTPLFAPVDAGCRIFRKRASAHLGGASVFGLRGPPAEHFIPRFSARGRKTERPFVRQVERILLEDLAPPSVVVDARQQVLYFAGRTARYLGPPAGSTPTNQLLDLVKRPMRHALREAMSEARESQATVRRTTRVEDESLDAVEIVVQPLRVPDIEPLLLVTFREATIAAQPSIAAPPRVEDGDRLLELELREARAELEATVVELEGTNDELKDANDELLSMNEELQSANEELQTSKEELQSMNEELRMLNQELARNVEALDRANADLRNLFASTDVATLFLDRDLVINRFTPRATRLFRFVESDRGRPITDITTRFAQVDLVAAAKGVLASLEPSERQIFSPEDGRSYVARIHPYRTLDDVVDGVVLTFIDVTDLKREIVEREIVERELELQRDRLHTALEGSSIRVFNQDHALRYTWVYDSHDTAFGGTLGKTDSEILGASDESSAVTQIKRRVLATGTAERAEVSMTLAGDPRTFELRVRPVLDATKKVVGLTGAAVDVTEARRAAEALLATEREFRAVFEADASGNAELELPSGRLIRCNPRFAVFAGFDEAALVGMGLTDLVLSEDREILDELLADLTAEHRTNPTIEVRFRRPDGRTVWAQLAGAHVDDPGHGEARGVLVAIDVTDRHDLEEKLLHARKVEAVGRLAGGIAHDFNNLITVASAHLELMQLAHPGQHTLDVHVEGIGAALGRAAELTQQLLTFARRQAIVPRPILPGDLVRHTERILQRVIGADIELVVRAVGEPGPIRADPAQIEQMLLNLVLNARDAMPNGGRIEVDATEEALDEHRLSGIPDVNPGRYVCFSVKDDGSGMDPGTLAQCLDPFFSTKAVGKGTGLGLSSVYGSARQSGGFVEIESRLDEGTTVRIYLPCTAEPVVTPVVPLPPPAVRPTGGGETILLVEDEPALLELNREALSMYGYHVLTAENGARALEIARDHLEPIHIVVTDVLMPVVGGLELAARLPDVRPGVPILFVSGHTGSALPDDAAFLPKPFMPSELARRVRAEIDAHRDRGDAGTS